VAPDVLLTAAHCHEWFDTIRIADHNSVASRGRSANVHDFDEVIRHPNFVAKTFENDMMVIRLKEPVEDATIVRMNNINEIPLRLQTLTVVGWGAIPDQQEFPGILHYARVPYVPNERCENTVYQGKQLYKDEISSTMMCAGGDGVDACRGDSGSPLVIPSPDGDLLVGLVSWGRGCAIYPGVYSRMSSFYNWARTHVCYLSSTPPEYLACKANERGPYTTQSPSTVEAKGSPTAAPSFFSNSDSSILNSTNSAVGNQDASGVMQPAMRDRKILSSGSHCRCQLSTFVGLMSLSLILVRMV